MVDLCLFLLQHIFLSNSVRILVAHKEGICAYQIEDFLSLLFDSSASLSETFSATLQQHLYKISGSEVPELRRSKKPQLVTGTIWKKHALQWYD
jgi:hypothetical protein